LIQGVYEYEAATSGLDPAQMARLADNAEASAVAIPLLVVFLAGVVIGSLIVAWSLWRRRIAPFWSPAAIAVGTILNLLADSATMSAPAFAFQLVGFGWVGLRLLHGADANAWRASSTTSSAPA
jgi:F0F1-type ATP synthase assembly protein I